MAEIVAFKADTTDQDECVGRLEAALELAKSGNMVDVAVVAAVNVGNGPEMWMSYWGNGSYSTLLAALDCIRFDLHYSRYDDDA